MIIGYARVSTIEQNLDLQIDALKKAGCDQIFTEKKSGASQTNRPALKEALQYLRRGDVLMVWRLDRLGRNQWELINLMKQFETDGIHFKSLHDGIDTTHQLGKLFFTIIAALSEMERDLIRERSAAGRVAAKERGVKFGRPVKFTNEHAKKAISLHEKGMSHREIYEFMGITSATYYRGIREYKKVME